MKGLICFTGYPASGKSTASDIASDAGIPVVTMGGIVRAHAHRELGADATSAAIGDWASAQRAQHGPTVFADATADEIETQGYDTVVVDGVRSPDELATFRRRFDTVTLVFVDAPFETRLARIQARGRADEESFTADDLSDRDATERDWGLDDLTPDARLMNTDTQAAFEVLIRDLLGVTDTNSVDCSEVAG